MAKDPSTRWPTAVAFASVARRAASELATVGQRPVVPATSQGQPPRVTGHGPVTPTPTPTSPGYVRPGQPVPVYVQAPVRQTQQGSNTGLIVAIIVAVVLVAICVGAAIAIVQQQQNRASSSGTTPASGTTAVGAQWGPAVHYPQEGRLTR
jgi:serine/threonine-protein kinase